MFICDVKQIHRRDESRGVIFLEGCKTFGYLLSLKLRKILEREILILIRFPLSVKRLKVLGQLIVKR